MNREEVVMVCCSDISGQLRGKGFPTPRGGHGDLYAEIVVVVPERPSERERELFEALAEASSFRPR